MSDHSEANRRWENQLEEFRHSNSCRELLETDGEPVEFEWKIFPGLTYLEILQKIQKDLQDRNIEPEKFEDRIIFMSIFKDIEWTKKGHSEKCISTSEQVKNYAKRFSRGHWTSLGLGDGKKWYGTSKKAVIQYSRVFDALNRRILKNNRDTIHFNADASNTELFFRTIHSANQPSINGAAPSWCEEFGLRPNERADFGKVRGKRK